MGKQAWVYYHLFLAMIISANVAIHLFGAATIGALVVPWGTFFAGATFVFRDLLHRLGGHGAALSAIAVGCLISYGFSNPALALASGTAFLLAELTDMAVFSRVVRWFSLAAGVFVSGVAGALVDTFVFLPWSGIPMTTGLVAGQVIIKSAMSGVGALALIRVRNLATA